MDGEYRIEPSETALVGVLRVSDLFSTVARVLGTNVATYLTITAICLAPALALQIAEHVVHSTLASRIESSSIGAVSAAAIGTVFAQVVLTFVAQAAMIGVTVDVVAGRSPRIGDALRRTVPRLGTVLFAAILVAAIDLVGLVLCLVPGVILACMLFVTIPVAVMEGTGPIESMKRSARLSDGHKATIFMALLVVLLAAASLGCALDGAVGPARFGRETTLVEHLSFVVGLLFDVLSSMVVAALGAVVYTRLRGVREGVDAREIASVFA